MDHLQDREFRSSKNYGGPRTSQPSDMLGNIPEDGTWRAPSSAVMRNGTPGRAQAGGGNSQNMYDTPTVAKSREPTEEDLKWKLRYAHLYSEMDWMQEITAVCQVTNSMRPMEQVLRNLREYPMDIHVKLRLSKKLRKDLGYSALNRTFTRRKSLKTRGHEIQRKTSNSLGFSRGGFSPMALWGDTIGRIAANFGTNVASYFTFLRFLVVINALMCVIMFFFVSLPQIITRDVKTAEVKSGFFGELSSTIFFFGAYSNNTIGRTAEETSMGYKRPLAYLMTWSCANFLAVLIIVISMYVNYRRIKGYNSGDSEPYSAQLFTAWDFSIISKKGVEKMKGFIVHYLRETKKEESFKKGLTSQQKLSLYLIRILCNLVSIGVLGGSAYLIYYVASNTIKAGLDVPTVIRDFFQKYQLPLLVSGLKVVIPPLLSLMLYIERYHPRTEIKVNIARTAVFYAASLVVFLASVYAASNKCVSAPAANSTAPAYCCWENEVGEQLFQMVILDLIVCIVVGLLVTGGQYSLYKFGLLRKFGKPDFNVANQILDLVYGQSLIWLGLYAAPFFAMVALVKLIIIFYFNYSLTRVFCEPNNVFRASRSGTFYLFILLTTLFVCLFPMTYAIIKLKPSDSCGPFKMYDRVYEVLTDEIGDSPDWLQDIIEFASTPAVIIPVLIILILIAIYYKAKSATLHAEAKELRHHLEFERKVEKRKIYATAKLAQGISVSSGLDVAGRMSAPLDNVNKPKAYGAMDDRVAQAHADGMVIQGEPDEDYDIQLDREDGHRHSRGQGPSQSRGQGYPPGDGRFFQPGGNEGYRTGDAKGNHLSHPEDSPFQRAPGRLSGDHHRLAQGGIRHDQRQLTNSGHHNAAFYNEPDDDEFQFHASGLVESPQENPHSRQGSNFY